MKTTVWLKQQPNKEIEYPDCWPQFNSNGYYKVFLLKILKELFKIVILLK
jgi:hypothetical protein